MRVQIINCSSPGYWYSNKIGEQFDVIFENKNSYETNYTSNIPGIISSSIVKSDCIDINILKKNKLKIIKEE